MIAPPKPPSHDDTEALIKEARARQLRRRLLGAAGVAITAALGLGIYALVSGGGPAQLAQPPSQGRATVPRCRSSQLAAGVGFQGATQTDVGGADVKNTGGRSCSLPAGWPRVRLTSDGRRLAVEQRRPPRTARATPTRVLASGATTVVEMQWANWCDTAHTSARQGGEVAPFRVVFSIRLGPGLVATAATTGGPPCLAVGSPSTLVVDRPRPDS